MHYRTLPFIDQMLSQAKHDHDEPVQEGKKGDLISIFNVLVDFGSDGLFNARLVVKHFGESKNYYDHKLTTFEALSDSRLQSEDSGRLNNASDGKINSSSANVNPDSEKNPKNPSSDQSGKVFSLRKHQQVNPIVVNGCCIPVSIYFHGKNCKKSVFFLISDLKY